MKPEEALKNIGDWISEETQKRKYDKLTVIELSDSLITLKEAIEKQIPKKPERLNAFRSIGKCGGCERVISARNASVYCMYCGNKVDWGSEK